LQYFNFLPEPLGIFLEQEIEATPVPGIEEDVLPGVAVQSDVTETPLANGFLAHRTGGSVK